MEQKDWIALHAKNTTDIHVIPRNDLIQHEMQETCICGPETQPVETEEGTINWVHIHHSLDNREANE